MKHFVALAAVALACSACVETSGGSANSTTAAGPDYGGEIVSVTLRDRAGTGPVASISGGLDFSCTGVFDEMPLPGESELTTINCTDGITGTATVVYDAAAQPERFVYSRPGASGGSLTF